MAMNLIKNRIWDTPCVGILKILTNYDIIYTTSINNLFGCVELPQPLNYYDKNV